PHALTRHFMWLWEIVERCWWNNFITIGEIGVELVNSSLLVAKRVAAHLSTDPLKLRFTTAHPTTGTHKAIIKRSTTQTLSEMLQTSYLPNSANLLYYEMLEISIVELETKKFFKVCWLGTTIKEEEVIDVRLPKTAIINDILEALLQKLSLSVPTDRIRLYEVLHCKIQKEYDSNDPIDKIQEQST
ncbi:16325_t:CDS:2, partial [Dentiscutata heterogama]